MMLDQHMFLQRYLLFGLVVAVRAGELWFDIAFVSLMPDEISLVKIASSTQHAEELFGAATVEGDGFVWK